MSNRNFNQDATNKLKQLVKEGIAVYEEIETLQGGLKDTVKALAEELELKPSLLTKAIKTAYKSTLEQTNNENEELNHIMQVMGKA